MYALCTLPLVKILARVAVLLAIPVLLLATAATACADAPAVVRRAATQDGLPIYTLPVGAVPFRVAPKTAMFRAEYRFSYRGVVRSFRVFVPTGLVGPAPTVIALHGLYQSAQSAQGYMAFQNIATAKHFIVAYPQGSDSSWNAGRCCGQAVTKNADDIGFISQVQAYLNAIYPTNVHRRYLAGFSNGGMMASRIACARPSAWAGLVMVSGAHVAPCTPTGSVAFMHVHGDADTTVPWNGTAWSTFLHCRLPSVAGTDHVWSRPGNTVKLVRVVGGGHSWSADTTAQAWSFLWAHSN